MRLRDDGIEFILSISLFARFPATVKLLLYLSFNKPIEDCISDGRLFEAF